MLRMRTASAASPKHPPQPPSWPSARRPRRRQASHVQALHLVQDHGLDLRLQIPVIGAVDDVQVRDALARVHHGERGPGLVDRLDVRLDLGLFCGGKTIEPGQDIGEAVVDVGADLVEHFGMFVERLFVENRHAVTEHDGIGDLHHGCFEVQ